MKRLTFRSITALLLWCFGLIGISRSDEAGMLTLRSGESIPAQLLSGDEATLRIRSDWFLAPVGVMFESLLFFEQNRGGKQENSAESACLVLRNGDTLYGRLSSMGTDELGWKTTWGASVRVKKATVDSIDCDKHLRFSLAGREAAWIVPLTITPKYQNGVWLFSEGANIGIADPSDGPKRIHMQGILSYPSSMSRCLLSLWSYGTIDRCDLLLSSERMSLTEIRHGETTLHKETDGINAPVQKIDLYVDGENGIYVLYCNGKRVLAEQRRTPCGREAKQMLGKTWNLLIEGGTIILRDWDIYDWNGVLPDERSYRESGPALSGKSILILKNGDVLNGELSVPKEGIIHVHSPHYELDVPMERVHAVPYCHKRIQESESFETEHTVRIRLFDSGVLKMRWTGIRNGAAEGVHEYLGKLSIPVGYIEQISFDQPDSARER